MHFPFTNASNGQAELYPLFTNSLPSWKSQLRGCVKKYIPAKMRIQNPNWSIRRIYMWGLGGRAKLSLAGTRDRIAPIKDTGTQSSKTQKCRWLVTRKRSSCFTLRILKNSGDDGLVVDYHTIDMSDLQWRIIVWRTSGRSNKLSYLNKSC